MEVSAVMFWSMVGLIVFAVLAFTIGNFVRDLSTRNINMVKVKDHIWVEFAPRQATGWDELVKLKDQQTGEFEYKGRTYFAGQERYSKLYPPGRSKMAQVPFHKTIARTDSADMALNLTGKPTVNPQLTYSLLEQKDTKTAMDRGSELSGGSTSAKANQWVLIGLGIVGVAVIAILIIQLQGQTQIADIGTELNKLKSAFPGLN